MDHNGIGLRSGGFAHQRIHLGGAVFGKTVIAGVFQMAFHNCFHAKASEVFDNGGLHRVQIRRHQPDALGAQRAERIK